MAKPQQKKQQPKSTPSKNTSNLLNIDSVTFKPTTQRKNTWYYAGQQYNYDIRKKLQKQGCRQSYRFSIQCRNNNKGISKGCQKADQDYKQCMKFYKYLVKKKNQ